MLREEELNASPPTSSDKLNQDRAALSRKPTGEKEFSFIQQNRVPSPLNNNFLLSEEQSRCHIRQVSEGFMAAANNLMNQDEFKNGMPNNISYMPHQYLIDNQEMIEEDVSNEGDDDDNERLETSKMSLFISAYKKGKQNNNNCIIENLESQVNAIIEGPLITESNNDDFNYSESNYQYAASSSLGAIIQGMNGGSFIGVNQNQPIPNLQLQSSKNQRMLTSGRGSATPFNYDENSLMNLSYTPSSTNNNFLMKGSSLGAVHRPQHQPFQQNLIVEVLDDHEQEETKNEQDESMIYPCLKPQDEWFHHDNNYKKTNPLEMPLQMQDQHLFSRAKLTEEELSQFLYQNAIQQMQQPQTQEIQQDIDEEDVEDEIQMIKKKLDFSRLSSMQNLSQQQMQYLPTTSFLFQTYQSQMSIGGGGGGNDNTQHYSTFQGAERENPIPFEELLNEQQQHINTKNSRNTLLNKEYQSTQTIKRDEGVQVDNSNMDRFSCETASNCGIYQEPGISPPSRTKTSLNSNRPPLIKPIQQQQHVQVPTLQQLNMFPSKLTVTNGNQPIQLNCINIFQAAPNNIPDPTLPQNQYLYQVPPASGTNSTNSYSNSIVEVQSNHLNQHNKKQKNHIYCNPHADTPGEPSSIMVEAMNDTYIFNNSNGQIQTKGRKIIQMVNDSQLLQQQQLFNKYMATTMTYQNSESNILFLEDHLTDNSQEHHQLNNQDQKAKTKGKKKIKDANQQQQRVGSSKQRNTQPNTQDSKINLQKQQLSLQGFMSKTMIISKDKIQPVTSKGNIINEESQKQQQIIENIINQNQIQRYKQTKVKKAKLQPSTTQHSLNHPTLNSGRSLPNSNLSSAQTSFLNANAPNNMNLNKKNQTQKTTTTKKPQNPAQQVISEEAVKLQKVKKKNKSILRNNNHLTNLNTQHINLPFTDTGVPIVVLHNHKKQTVAKCNTHRSVSRPKSGIKKEIEIVQSVNKLSLNPNAHDLILLGQPTLQLGKKKHSQQVFTSNIINNPSTTVDKNNNKENIKPHISKIAIGSLKKKSVQIGGASSTNTLERISARPDQIIQSYENTVKMINPQDLLKEIYQKQQKMIRQQNFSQNQLFTTMGTTTDDQCTKRIKTEENNYNNNQFKFIESEIDPYHMLTTTLDSQRQINRNMNQQNSMQHLQTLNSQQYPDNIEIYDHLYKAAINQYQLQQNQRQHNSTSNIMNKMQSPYNSKTMKNKFSTNKNKQKIGGVLNTQNVNTEMGIKTGQLKSTFMNGVENGSQQDECKRCDELIHILKNTRFLAR